MTTRDNLLRASLALGLLVVLIIAFFTRGGTHGMYADDYVYKLSPCGFSPATGQLEIELSSHRVIGNLFASCLTQLLPDYEIGPRIGIVVIHLLNVCLLAWLGWRVTGSRLVALLSAVFFLAPLPAYEGIVWFDGAIFYTLPLSLLLAGMHLALSDRTFPGQYLVLGGAVVAWILMALFIESGFFVLVLLPLFVWMLRRRGLPIRLRARIPMLALTFLFIGGYSFFVLRQTPIIALHGDTTFDPVYILFHRIPETADSVFSYLARWQPSGPFFQAMQLGLDEWSRNGGILVLAALGVSLAFSVFLYSHEESPSSGKNNYLLLAGVGLAWFVLALAPVLFFVNLTVSSRVLLFPSAGLALAAAGLLGWLVNRLGRWQPAAARVVLCGAVCGLVVNGLGMAGMTQVYRLRWELDQKQLQMLRPGVAPITTPIWLLPLGLNNRSVSAYWNRETVLDRHLYGLLQVSWAARPALRMAFPGKAIDIVDRDMAGHVHVTGVEKAPDGSVRALVIEGTVAENRVPIDQLVAFTFRQDHLVLLNPLIITGTDGPVELNLPLARARPDVASQPWEMAIEENK